MRSASTSTYTVTSGCSRRTGMPVATWMAAPSSRSISGDVRGKPLKDRRAVTRNEAAEGRHRGRGVAPEHGQVERRFVRAREVRHPEEVAQPALGFRPGHLVGEIDAQAPGQDVDLAVQIGQEPSALTARRSTKKGRLRPLSAISW